jgi:hypothetical protein
MTNIPLSIADPTLVDYAQNVCDGKMPGAVFVKDYGDGKGICAHMWLMDMEFDPVRVSFDIFGFVSIHADKSNYWIFSATQLGWIAARCSQGQKLSKKVFDLHEDSENPKTDERASEAMMTRADYVQKQIDLVNSRVFYSLSKQPLGQPDAQ